jgi:two-component system sensor histidine kinase/response regulator
MQTTRHGLWAPALAGPAMPHYPNPVAKSDAELIETLQARVRELEYLVASHDREVRAEHAAAEAARRAQTESLRKLRETEHLRDDLVKMIVYDLRGLLLVVLANMEFVRDQVQGQPRADLDEAIKAANEVKRLANTLLDVNQLEGGGMPIALAPCDLGKLITESAQSLRLLEPTRTIDIGAVTTVQAFAPLRAKCDAELMRRVIDNLIINAVKHTPAGGTVRVTAERANDMVRVAVHDGGPGIPDDVMVRIFDKFGWIKPGVPRSYHSAGLGLAFCKLAIEAHGGTIVASNSTPRGAVFTVEIPA